MFDKDKACPECYGMGMRQDYATSAVTKCQDCFGTGREFTEAGKQLVSFLKEYYALVPKR